MRSRPEQGLFVLTAAAALACSGPAEGPSELDLGESQEAVIGGTTASAGSAPYIVHIGAPGYPLICSGVLLNSFWFVTGAHCVANYAMGDYTITLGEYDRSQPEGTEQVRHIAAIVPHGRFVANGLKNDIALVRLDEPAALGQSVGTIALPEGRFQPGATGTIWGWGQTFQEDTRPNPTMSNLLKKASLQIGDQATCAAGLTVYTLLPSMLCAGAATGNPGGCWGDSGGPFTAQSGGGITELVGLTSWGGSSCNQYTAFTRVSDYVPWIREQAFGWPRFACQGQTPKGFTPWQQYGTEGIFVDVDTTQCNYGATPEYFTSLGGSTNHDAVQGTTSIYIPTATGFRVYLNQSGITPSLANSRGWHVNWQAVPVNMTEPQLCSGRTTAGSTGWIQYGTDGVYVNVDTTRCDGTSPPTKRYFTSLGGSSNHWTTSGVTSIYSPTESGFRVYVRKTGITPQQANLWNWHVNWAATAAAQGGGPEMCTGASSPGSGWVQNQTDSIYLDVSTTVCGRTVTPLYFTTLGANTSHWTALGVTSIYSATATGFRVYLKQSGITPALATQRGYFVNWAAYP